MICAVIKSLFFCGIIFSHLESSLSQPQGNLNSNTPSRPPVTETNVGVNITYIDSRESSNVDNSYDKRPVFHDRMEGLKLSQGDRMGEIGTGVAIPPAVSLACNDSSFESSIAQYRNIHSLTFPKSEPELQSMCIRMKNLQAQKNNFANTCSQDKMKEAFLKLFQGFDDTVENLCNSNVYKTKYLQVASCMSDAYSGSINATCKLEQDSSNSSEETKKNFTNTMQEICKVYNPAMKCLKEEITKKCGLEVANFFECHVTTNLGDIYKENCKITQSGCENELSPTVENTKYEVVSGNSTPASTGHERHEQTPNKVNTAEHVTTNIVFSLIILIIALIMS